MLAASWAPDAAASTPWAASAAAARSCAPAGLSVRNYAITHVADSSPRSRRRDEQSRELEAMEHALIAHAFLCLEHTISNHW